MSATQISFQPTCKRADADLGETLIMAEIRAEDDARRLVCPAKWAGYTHPINGLRKFRKPASLPNASLRKR